MEQHSPQALRQLAQYQPFRDGGKAKDAAFERMIPAVLMEFGGSVASPVQLGASFQGLFGVEVEAGELEAWLGHLAEAGEVELGSGVSLRPQAKLEMEKRRSAFEALRETAEKEWRISMIGLDPSISDQELDVLWDGLDEVIGLMVAYHGAEAALVLYPEEPQSEVLLQTLHAQLKAVPIADSELPELRREGFSKFFLAPTESQRRYLADRLDHGFFATVGTLRPGAAVEMRNAMAGHRIYLDTNVLIPALGLTGARMGAPTKRLLQLTQSLGVEIAVTSKTIEEFRHSLKHARNDVERDLPDRRYARVLRDTARRNGGSSLAEGFFESYEELGSTVDTWFGKAEVLGPRLEELNINVVDDGLDVALGREAGRVDAYLELLGTESARRGRPRDDHPMRHDAVHRVLVEHLRGGSQLDFGSARYWFVTEDRLLPDFGHRPLPGEPRPRTPFCISASGWAQIVRCFTPRTDDYDQMVTDLLASPYMSFGSASLPEVQHVVSRITTLVQDASPAVVAAFIGKEVLEAVAGVKEQSEEDEVLLEAYKKKEDKMQNDLDLLESRFREMRAELDASEAEREAIGRLESQLEETRVRLGESESARQRQRVLDAEEISKLKQDKADAERDRIARRRRLKVRARAGVCAVILAILIALTVLGLVSVGVLLIAGGVLVGIGAAPMIEESRRAWEVGFVLGVLGVVLSVVQLLE